METVAARIAAIRERMAAAARRAGHAPDAVQLVGVTKTHPPELVAEALVAGLHDVGENRVQEAEQKMAALAAVHTSLRWHLIGHLQSNKARRAAALFDIVHSVDSVHLAQALARGVADHAPLPVLLQVNVSGEASKDGFSLAGWEVQPPVFAAFCHEVEQVLALPELLVQGLMTIAPWSEDPERARPCFRSTRRLRDVLAQRFPAALWDTLSMGMTDDFEVAIEEGATLVRVGRAIFGQRG